VKKKTLWVHHVIFTVCSR